MVVKNIFYSLIIKVTDIALPVILLPILLNRIGPEVIGSIGYFTALTLFFIPFIQYGMSQNGIVLYLQSLEDGNSEQLLSTYFTYSITVAMLVSVIVAFICYYSNHNFLLGFFTCIYVVLNGLAPNWYFQAKSNLKVITVLNSAIKIIVFVCVFYFVYEKNDAVMYPALLLIGALVLYFFQMSVIFKNEKLSFATADDVKCYLHKHFPLFKIQFVPNFYNNFSIYYLSFWCDQVTYGYFITAQRISEVFSNINLIAINSYLPKINSSFSSIKDLYRFINFSSILLIVFIVVGYLIPIDTYGQMYPVFVIFSMMCPAIIIHNYMNYYGLAGLSYFKKYEYMSTVTVFFSIIGFLACLYFIKIHGLIASIFIVMFTRLLIYISFNYRYSNVSKIFNKAYFS
jgi:PST family polysaccharide transporter